MVAAWAAGANALQATAHAVASSESDFSFIYSYGPLTSERVQVDV